MATGVKYVRVDRKNSLAVFMSFDVPESTSKSSDETGNTLKEFSEIRALEENSYPKFTEDSSLKE